jgi:hypothetical protein
MGKVGVGNLNNLFKVGLAISCTGLIMLFTYFLGNELLKQLSGVAKFWYLTPLLAIIAATIFIGGLAMIVRAGGYYGK